MSLRGRGRGQAEDSLLGQRLRWDEGMPVGSVTKMQNEGEGRRSPLFKGTLKIPVRSKSNVSQVNYCGKKKNHALEMGG